jgi:PleD family two-component response regulator
LLSAIREATMPHGEQVTVSIGIAQGHLQTSNGWQKLYAQADAALYRAKGDGRNRYHQDDVVEETASEYELAKGTVAA